ncbi:DDE-1 domain-containing protein [Aphis craccivora]|uniref:DDE-1 domain-containing protein n=1 Tax=Aphis craccivora TaxID=307492 RepID=A0A6G0YDE1_APHCR|nr:DDE-1 domain-containing protein [Aphis craccivora]
MFAMYSILKPPKTGNCTILDTNIEKITINDLKTIFNQTDINDRTEKITNIQRRLDLLVLALSIEVEDIFESDIHSYFKADTDACVLYYICGYVTRYLTTSIKCNVCLTAVSGQTNISKKPEAALTNIKTRGGLTHPNIYLFQLLTAIENSFSKYCDDHDVFELTVDDFFSNN